MRDRLRLLLTGLLLCSGSITALAAEYTAGDPCTEAGAFHTRNDATGAQHLVCNGSVWVLTTAFFTSGKIGAPQYCDTSGANCFNAASVGSSGGGSTSAAAPNESIQFNSASSFSGASTFVYKSATGRVGIGTSSPTTTVDVNGEVRVGSTGLSCGGTTAGAMRYATGCIQFCNGTSWACINQISGCDTVPAAFDFTDLTGLTASTLTTSSILAITGTDSGCNTMVSVSGSGSPNFRTCSDSACSSVVQNWTANNTALDMNGKYLQVRATTAGTASTTYDVTVSVGGVTNNWSLSTTSTGPCGNVGPGDEGTVCSDGSIYAGVSPDGNRNMYVPRCDQGQSWSGSACTGTRSIFAWNNGTSNWTYTGFTSQVTGAANTTGLVNLVDAGSAYAAAVSCDGATTHSQSDWYLPSSNELDVIRTKISSAGTANGFSGTYYWSSSEIDSTSARGVAFSSGTWNQISKNNAAWYVRCARKD